MELLVGVARPVIAYGLAVFSKRVMLFGSEGSAKIFSSKAAGNGFDPQQMMRRNRPEAVVEVVDPLLLSVKTVDVCDCCRCDCDVVELPAAISGCFDGELAFSSEGKRLYVTLGQFSIIRLERDAQLLIPSFDYCIPQKECSATGSAAEEDPCDLFSRIEFPTDDFFPPQNTVRDLACGCSDTAGASTAAAGNSRCKS